MSAIGHAFQALGEGIKHTFEGLGHVLHGAFTLNLREMAGGAGEMATGALGTAMAVSSLTPTAICVNTLMDGAGRCLRRRS